MTQTTAVCPDCGERKTDFREGRCTDCHAERQHALDEHNARSARWAGFSDRKRGDEIRRAM